MFDRKRGSKKKKMNYLLRFYLVNTKHNESTERPDTDSYFLAYVLNHHRSLQGTL